MGDPINEHETARGSGYNNLKNWNFSNIVWPYGISRQNIENFKARFSWAEAEMKNPHSAFYKQAKAFGLGGPNQPQSFGPIAPRGRFIIPQNKANASHHAGNEDMGTRRIGQGALNKFLDVFSGGAMPTALGWLDHAALLPSQAGYPAGSFQTPMTGTSAAAAASGTRKIANWYSQTAAAMDNARSLAPHGAELQRRYFSATEGPGLRKSYGQAAFLNPAMPRARFNNFPAATQSSRSANIDSVVDDTIPQSPASALNNEYMRRDEFDGILENYFNRQARLPPSGYTGFDPWLSPAWPGRKLPN